MPAVTPDIDDRLFAEVEADQRVLLTYEDHPGTGLFHVQDDPTGDVRLRAVTTGAEILVHTDSGKAFTAGNGRGGHLGDVAGTVPVRQAEAPMRCRRCGVDIDWYVTEARDDGSEQYICTDCASERVGEDD